MCACAHVQVYVVSERGSPVCYHLNLLLWFSQQHPCSSLHCLHSPCGFCLVWCMCGVTCTGAHVLWERWHQPWVFPFSLVVTALICSSGDHGCCCTWAWLGSFRNGMDIFGRLL